MAHTIMIHYIIHSPQGNITAELCPMDIDHAVWLYNRITRDDSGMFAY